MLGKLSRHFFLYFPLFLWRHRLMRHTRCLRPCSAATASRCVLSCRYFLAAQSSLALEISLQSFSRDSLISNIMSRPSDKKCMNAKTVTSFKDVQKIYIFLAWYHHAKVLSLVGVPGVAGPGIWHLSHHSNKVARDRPSPGHQAPLWKQG